MYPSCFAQEWKSRKSHFRCSHRPRCRITKRTAGTRRTIGGTSPRPKKRNNSMGARHPEQQYLDLMRECIEKGDRQVDQGHGKAHFGLFGRQIRFNLGEGFPLLTTKRVYWKGVLHELYWFMSGQTNIKYLVDNEVHIWDDYPYSMYMEHAKQGKWPEMTKEEFIG